MSGALDGIKVLDLSRVLAGPWASQLLADLGATVIKVEKPGAGDDTRHWGPPNLPDGTAGYFLAANRGKQSITVDITQPEGRAIVQQLAAEADVLLENYKVGGLKKYGLDYPTLKAINPRLVYCSITGFGQTGPYASRPGYDYIVQGMSGLMSITGPADGEPHKVGVAVTDLFSGLYASNAICAALLARERSGEGQAIDLALFDCALAMLANINMNWLVGGEVPPRLGNAHPNIVPYQVFATSDGHFILACGNDSQFARIAARRVQVGDVLRVHPGETFTADGVLTVGTTRVDEALLTGESRPLARRVGDAVWSGSHNLTSTVQLRVERIGASTRFAQIVALMESASATKPEGAELADRIAKPFLIAVLLAAAGACAWWWWRDPGHALMLV